MFYNACVLLLRFYKSCCQLSTYYSICLDASVHASSPAQVLLNLWNVSLTKSFFAADQHRYGGPGDYFGVLFIKRWSLKLYARRDYFGVCSSKDDHLNSIQDNVYGQLFICLHWDIMYFYSWGVGYYVLPLLGVGCLICGA